MRTSILSRSVIAVASLAIGSVALAATPATAAAPSVITRDMVLSITNSLRTAEADETEIPEATWEGINRLVELGCDSPAGDNNSIEGTDFKVLAAGPVDGVVISAVLHEANAAEQGSVHRVCTFGALVTTDASFTLSGEATIAPVEVPAPIDQLQLADRAAPTAAPAPVHAKLSGDVFATPALSIPGINSRVSFSTTGNATKTTAVTTARKIWDKTSKAEKKAAKKKYDRRIATAKKAYKKALHQAGGSAGKKAAAKGDYSAKRAKIVTRYQHEVWNYRYVKKPGTKTENHPFNGSVRVHPLFLG